MIVVYDFDETLEKEEKDLAYISSGGERIALDTEGMARFFEDVLARFGKYAHYEAHVQEDEELYNAMLESVGAMTTLPAKVDDEMSDKEHALTFLRFLFLINQRQLKRFLCDSVIFPERAD